MPDPSNDPSKVFGAGALFGEGENILEATKRLVRAFQEAHPGKKIAIQPDGSTKLVDEPSSSEPVI